MVAETREQMQERMLGYIFNLWQWQDHEGRRMMPRSIRVLREEAELGLRRTARHIGVTMTELSRVERDEQ